MIKAYLWCFEDIKTARKLFLNGLLSIDAMNEIVMYNKSVIDTFFTDLDAETQDIINKNFWSWI